MRPLLATPGKSPGHDRSHECHSASYQSLIKLADRAERTETLQASIDDMKAGNVIPTADVLAEMRSILAEKQSQ